MIDSGLFSKSQILENSVEEYPTLDGQKYINRSTLYHLILSFAKTIYDQPNILKVQKTQIVTQFGHNIGKNIAQQESLGNFQYFILKQKYKNKQYLGQFKFLNIKVWPCIFGSSSKLFAVVGQTSGYKLQDKEFGLIKWLNGDEQSVRGLRRLLLQLSKGVLQGFLQRFDLVGQVSYSEVVDNNINFQVKNLTKMQKNNIK